MLVALFSFLCSEQQLIINLVTERPVSKLIALEIDYSSYAKFNPYWLGIGFPGMLRRIQKAKEILDAQVSQIL